METIGVIDYGMGNLHSLAKSLERVAGNQRIFVSYDTKALLECDRLVLPGVGGVRACMDELRRLELDQMVIEAARKRPLLGVCLGMQVLLERSDENGGVNALGLIPGSVVRFPDPLPETEPELHHERLEFVIRQASLSGERAKRPLAECKNSAMHHFDDHCDHDKWRKPFRSI